MMVSIRSIQPLPVHLQGFVWFMAVIYVFVQWYNYYFQLAKYGKFRETLVEAADPMIM